MIMHDEKVDRITDSTGSVSQLRWEELRKLDAGSWFSKEFRGVTIPTLDEVLHLAKDKASVVVSIKYAGIEHLVLDSLRGNHMLSKSIIVAPIDVSKRIKKAEPETAIMYNLEPTDHIMNDADRLVSDGVDIVNLHKSFAAKRTVDFCHRKGLKVDVFSVNEEIDVYKCIDADADYVMTDEPQLVIGVMRREGLR